MDICLRFKEQQIIFTAIKNHNQRVIQKSVVGNALLFCRLIRDADKLDILDQIINFYENPCLTPYLAVDSNDKDESYSPEIIQGILIGKQISYTCVKTSVDSMLIRLSWLLDLTFPTALEIAKSKRYLERLRALIPVTDDTLKVFQHIKEQLLNSSEEQ